MNPILWYTLFVLTIGSAMGVAGNVCGKRVTRSLKPGLLVVAIEIGVSAFFMLVGFAIAALVLDSYFPHEWWWAQ